MSEHREFCHNCGARITEPSAFCASCGAALALPASEAASDLGSASPPSAATATATAPTSDPPAGGAATSTTAEAPTGAASVDGAASTATRPTANAGAPPAGPPAAEDGETTQQRRWLPFAVVGGAAFIAVAAVVVLLLALGGSAGNNVKNAAATRQQALALLAANGTTTVSRTAPGLFAIVSAGNMTLAVPAGWRATAQSVGATTRAEFANPSHGSSSLTVVSERTGRLNAHARAVAARKAATAKGDSVTSLSAVSFPGGRQAWRLTYSAANLTHDTYFTTGCNSAVAIVVDAAAHPANIGQQQASLEQAAASVQPRC
jgi:hypothetical protein